MGNHILGSWHDLYCGSNSCRPKKLNDVKLPRVHPQINRSIAKVEVMTQEPALHSSLTLTVLYQSGAFL